MAGITYSITRAIETTTFHGFLQHDSAMLLKLKGLFRDEEGFYRGDLARITYSISHSIETAGEFSQLEPEKVGGFCT